MVARVRGDVFIIHSALHRARLQGAQEMVVEGINCSLPSVGGHFLIVIGLHTEGGAQGEGCSTREEHARSPYVSSHCKVRSWLCGEYIHLSGLTKRESVLKKAGFGKVLSLFISSPPRANTLHLHHFLTPSFALEACTCGRKNVARLTRKAVQY